MPSPFDSPAFANPFDSLGVNSFALLAPQEEERGFIGTLVDETVADFVGAGRVAGATLFSPFEAFGADVPISFDDISARDVAGAGAIAAMVLTGSAYKALQGAKIGATALTRAATTAGVEAAGGALYGALAAESNGDELIDSMVRNAATFGVIGAGASSLKSAYKATIGNFAAGLKAANARAQFAEAAQRFNVEQQAREFAGIKLLNPESSARIGIRRNSEGSVAATIYDAKGRGDTLTFADFNEALTFARSEGFVDDLGVFRSKPIKALESLTPEQSALMRENPEGIAGVVGKLELEDYRAWKQASADLADADAHLTASMAEVAMPSNEWGAPTFGSDSTRQQAARAAGILPAQAAKMSDPELLREMVLRGAVTPETLQAGVAQEELFRELFVNGLVPDGSVIVTSPINDSLFTSFLTARTLAKIHPEVAPYHNNLTARRHQLDLATGAMQTRLLKLRTAVPKEKALKGVEIIDASAEAALATPAAPSLAPSNVVIETASGTRMSADEFLSTGEELLHGTSREFDTFDAAGAPNRYGRAQQGARYYFTDKPEVADRFANATGSQHVDLERYAISHEDFGDSYFDLDKEDQIQLVDTLKRALKSKLDKGHVIDKLDDNGQYVRVDNVYKLTEDDLLEGNVRVWAKGRAPKVIKAKVYGKTLDLRDPAKVSEATKKALADAGIPLPEKASFQHEYSRELIEWARANGYGKIKVPDVVESGFESTIALPEFIGHGANDPLQNAISRGLVSPVARTTPTGGAGLSASVSSATISPVERARQIALQRARATGDEQIIHFVEESQQILGEYLQRFQDAGIVHDGLAGYFPIKNVGQWKVEVTRASGKVEFQGFHKSKEDAVRKLDELRAADETIKSARLVPNRITFDSTTSTIATMEPRQFAALTRAIKEASTEELTWREANELASEVARPSAGPLKSMGNLKQRKLGIRDFSLDPYEALSVYANGAERVLAYRDFERFSNEIIETIHPDKKALRSWVQQMTDDVLGRPRASEVAVQNLMEWLSEASGGKIPVAPRALAQFTAGLRKWTSFSRLGGFFSAAVNLTQITTNTFAKLGPVYTARGLEALSSRKKWREVTKLISESNVDLELFGTLVETGEDALHDTIKGALKEERYVEAAYRTSLFAFKGTEKINRVVTFWGAYQKGLAEGQTKELAAQYASDIVRSTQFDMHLTNNPEILRGPLGSTIGQFKSFIINEIEFIGSLNKQELARFGAGLWATGGLAVLFNMPGTDLVDAASGMFTDQKLSERLKIAPDSTLAKTAIFGLPGLANVDLSDHVGVGSLRDITRGLIGPAPQDIARLATFLRQSAIDVGAEGRINPETMRTFTQQVMPSATRRALRGWDILKHDGEVRNPYSQKLVYKSPTRMRTGVLTALGAPEIDSSQERTMDEIQVRIRERFVRARTAYAKEAGLAMREGRREEAMEILREAGARGYDIDARTLDYWTTELGRGAAERRERRTPQELRAHYASLFDATGTIAQ